jgi:hypothetical protein
MRLRQLLPDSSLPFPLPLRLLLLYHPIYLTLR